MSKRKVASEEAVANILWFVEANDDKNCFESDCEDELGLAGDDLDEIYDDDDDDDDDRNAADEDRCDDDEDEVEDRSSSDDDQPQPQPELGNRLLQKMLTLMVWSTQSTNCLTQIVFIHMILALLMMKNIKQF